MIASRIPPLGSPREGRWQFSRITVIQGLYRLVTWNAILLQGNTCLTAAVLLTLDSRFPEERYIWA